MQASPICLLCVGIQDSVAAEVIQGRSSIIRSVKGIAVDAEMGYERHRHTSRGDERSTRADRLAKV